MDILPLALLLPILLIAAVSDLRHLRISNNLSLIALGLFALCAPFLAFDEVLLRFLIAGVVFGIGFLMFALRIVAGGDVKLLSVLMLFIPSDSLLLFGYVFSASMLLGITIIICLRKKSPRLLGHWASVQQANALPMGISIAMAGVSQFLLLLWTA